MREMIFEHHIRFAESFPELASSSAFTPPDMPAHEFDKTKLDENISESVKEGMQFIVDVFTSAILNSGRDLGDSERQRLRDLNSQASEISNYDEAVDLLNEFGDTVTHEYFDVDGDEAYLKKK